jgi:hypothetical protein
MHFANPNSRTTLIDAAPLGVLHRAPWVADVAQLVERQVVVLDVVGSKPIVRPRFSFS